MSNMYKFAKSEDTKFERLGLFFNEKLIEKKDNFYYLSINRLT